MELRWANADEIGYQLSETHPAIAPLTLRFTQLHAYIVALPDFADDPQSSSEGILEAIQMAWLDYTEDQ